MSFRGLSPEAYHLVAGHADLQGAGMTLQQFLATDSVFFVGVVLLGGFNRPRPRTTTLAVLDGVRTANQSSPPGASFQTAFLVFCS